MISASSVLDAQGIVRSSSAQTYLAATLRDDVALELIRGRGDMELLALRKRSVEFGRQIDERTPRELRTLQPKPAALAELVQRLKRQRKI